MNNISVLSITWKENFDSKTLELESFLYKTSKNGIAY